ncbi:putative ubiquitin-conjugating enzyme E2-binding protein [Plasmopara halstedii]
MFHRIEMNEVTEDGNVQTIVESFVEYQVNIGCYQCYLYFTQTVPLDITKCTIQGTFSRIALVYPCENDDEVGTTTQVLWYLDIKQHVDISTCTIEDKNDHWYMRLPVHSNTSHGFSSISSHELEAENYGTISCRTCTMPLVHSNIINKVLPLPSTNWMDMLDFWGAGDGAFEHIPREGIVAQPHRVLVGESFVLLHVQDFLVHAIVAHGTTTEGEWVPLKCTKCCVSIGLSSFDHVETIRLDKHLIHASKNTMTSLEDQENVFATYTVDSIVCAKILEQADADGTFRFRLTTGTLGTSMNLQLLSWNTLIKHRHVPTFRRVLKVLYKHDQVLSDHAYEIHLSTNMYATIVQRLQVSTTLLPVSLQTFNQMSIGYLYA